MTTRDSIEKLEGKSSVPSNTAIKPYLSPVDPSGQFGVSIPSNERIILGGFEGELSLSDLRIPTLGIAQGIGPLSEEFRSGAIVLDRQTELSAGASPVELTVIKCRKFYQEKLPYGSEIRPKKFETEEDVIRAGGTINWEYNTPPSYEPVLQVTVLVLCPDGVVGAFPYEYAEKDFAVADWYLRGMAYQRAGKLLLTTCAQLARAGQATYGTRWELTTTREKLKNGNTVVVPVLRMKGKHNADFAAFAASLLG